MEVRQLLGALPLVRQVRAGDALGLGKGSRSDRSKALALGMASLGAATLDNEENYLIKKLFTALGAIQIENHKRSFLYHVGEVAAA